MYCLLSITILFGNLSIKLHTLHQTSQFRSLIKPFRTEIFLKTKICMSLAANRHLKIKMFSLKEQNVFEEKKKSRPTSS